MARWRGHDEWKGEPWGGKSTKRSRNKEDDVAGPVNQKLDISHVQERTQHALGSARVPMPPTAPPLARHYTERERTKRARNEENEVAEEYHYPKSRSRSQSRVAPGSASVPMPPLATPLGQLFREVYAEDPQKAKSRSRSQTPTAPGSARAESQMSSQSERVALAAAQREAKDPHRLFLDRKYKKRAWKRQAHNPDAQNPEHEYPDDLSQRDWHELLALAPCYPPGGAPRG